MSSIRKWLGPLASRKVRVALATVIAAWLADRWPGAGEETVYTILSVGAAVILGIAVEDAGARVGGKRS